MHSRYRMLIFGTCVVFMQVSGILADVCDLACAFDDPENPFCAWVASTTDSGADGTWEYASGKSMGNSVLGVRPDADYTGAPSMAPRNFLQASGKTLGNLYALAILKSPAYTSSSKHILRFKYYLASYEAVLRTCIDTHGGANCWEGKFDRMTPINNIEWRSANITLPANTHKVYFVATSLTTNAYVGLDNIEVFNIDGSTCVAGSTSSDSTSMRPSTTAATTTQARTSASTRQASTTTVGTVSIRTTTTTTTTKTTRAGTTAPKKDCFPAPEKNSIMSLKPNVAYQKTMGNFDDWDKSLDGCKSLCLARSELSVGDAACRSMRFIDDADPSKRECLLYPAHCADVGDACYNGTPKPNDQYFENRC